MKLIIIVVALLFAQPYPQPYPHPQPIFYCNNGQTKVYHTHKDCQWLMKCNHPKELSPAELDSMKLRLCYTCKKKASSK